MILGAFSYIVNAVENGFYRWGVVLGNRPWIGILIALLVLATIGPVGALLKRIYFGLHLIGCYIQSMFDLCFYNMSDGMSIVSYREEDKL